MIQVQRFALHMLPKQPNRPGFQADEEIRKPFVRMCGRLVLTDSIADGHR
jgi:hypothetical protein